MKIITVNNMFECPFKFEEIYQLSEYTAGSDTKCTLREDGYGDCELKNCPLKEENIEVIWGVEMEGLTC